MFLHCRGQDLQPKDCGVHCGERFQELRDRLPAGTALKPGGSPAAGVPDFDNGRLVEVLGMRLRWFAESIEDTVRSLQLHLSGHTSGGPTASARKRLIRCGGSYIAGYRGG